MKNTTNNQIKEMLKIAKVDSLEELFAETLKLNTMYKPNNINVMLENVIAEGLVNSENINEDTQFGFGATGESIVSILTTFMKKNFILDFTIQTLYDGNKIIGIEISYKGGNSSVVNVTRRDSIYIYFNAMSIITAAITAVDEYKKYMEEPVIEEDNALFNTSTLQIYLSSDKHITFEKGELMEFKAEENICSLLSQFIKYELDTNVDVYKLNKLADGLEERYLMIGLSNTSIVQGLSNPKDDIISFDISEVLKVGKSFNRATNGFVARIITPNNIIKGDIYNMKLNPETRIIIDYSDECKEAICTLADSVMKTQIGVDLIQDITGEKTVMSAIIYRGEDKDNIKIIKTSALRDDAPFRFITLGDLATAIEELKLEKFNDILSSLPIEVPDLSKIFEQDEIAVHIESGEFRLDDDTYMIFDTQRYPEMVATMNTVLSLIEGAQHFRFSNLCGCKNYGLIDMNDMNTYPLGCVEDDKLFIKTSEIFDIVNSMKNTKPKTLNQEEIAKSIMVGDFKIDPDTYMVFDIERHDEMVSIMNTVLRRIECAQYYRFTKLFGYNNYGLIDIAVASTPITLGYVEDDKLYIKTSELLDAVNGKSNSECKMLNQDEVADHISLGNFILDDDTYMVFDIKRYPQVVSLMDRILDIIEGEQRLRFIKSSENNKYVLIDVSTLGASPVELGEVKGDKLYIQTSELLEAIKETRSSRANACSVIKKDNIKLYDYEDISLGQFLISATELTLNTINDINIVSLNRYLAYSDERELYTHLYLEKERDMEAVAFYVAHKEGLENLKPSILVSTIEQHIKDNDNSIEITIEGKTYYIMDLKDIIVTK